MIAIKDFIRNGIRKGGHWICLGTGAASAYILLLGKQVENHEEECVFRINGIPQTLDTDTVLRAEDVKRALDWDKFSEFQQQIELRLFPSKLQDMSHKGCMQLISGAAVGVPANFTSNFLKEAKENPSLLHQYSIDVETEEGRQMYELLKQKDKEIVRLYALAREMCQVRSSQHTFVALGIFASFSSVFHIAKLLTTVLRFRLLSYFATITFVTYGSLQGYDLLNRQYEKDVDKDAACISEFAAIGGIEYFDYLIAKEQLSKGSAEEKSTSRVESSTVDYLYPSQWLLQYRKPNLTLEERRRSLLSVIAKKYGNYNIEQQK